jgi:hypothetical protein
MTQASYESGYGAGGSAGTSALAIFSLICGILALLLSCFIVGGAILAPIGLLLGLLALVLKGQKSGGGLAVGGIVTSLIAIVVSAAVGFGAASLANQFGGVADVVVEAQRGDASAVRARLTTAASNELTDAQIIAWGAAAQNEIGTSSGVQGGLFGFFTGIITVTQDPDLNTWVSSHSGRNDGVIPLQVKTDRDEAIVFLRLSDNTSPAPGSFLPPLEDVGFHNATTAEIVWLRAGRESIASTPSRTTPPAPAPADPDADNGNGNG